MILNHAEEMIILLGIGRTSTAIITSLMNA